MLQGGAGRYSTAIVRIVLALSLALGFVGGLRDADASSRIGSDPPASLMPRVRFWIEVFRRYSVRDFIIHDRDKPWRVYGVSHLPGKGAPSRAQAAEIGRSLERKYSAILKRLASGATPVTSAGRRIAAELAGYPLKVYADAATNIRVQQGLREPFHRGLRRSGYYLTMIRRVFRRFALPTELLALAAVESQFHRRARSPAGALGIWQFMPATARRFMRVNRHRDDRLNPYRSTVAAAKLLRYNYRVLGSWPLAITAYEYGAGATARAVRQCGASIARIIRCYDGSGFGFAVQNYYAEFLAALELYRSAGEYFAGDGGAPAEDDDNRPLLVRYQVRRGDTLSRIAHVYHVSLFSLMRANHLRHARLLRVGMLLRIPGASSDARRYTVTVNPVCSHRFARKAKHAPKELVGWGHKQRPAAHLTEDPSGVETSKRRSAPFRSDGFIVIRLLRWSVPFDLCILPLQPESLRPRPRSPTLPTS